MKRIVLATLLLAALMTTAGLLAATASADPRSNESATVEFAEPVILAACFPPWQNRVEHDEDRMAKGEDCTYIYNRQGKLVVSFHCTPVQRNRAERFTIVTERDLTGTPTVREIQFSGSTEAHQAPSRARLEASTEKDSVRRSRRAESFL